MQETKKGWLTLKMKAIRFEMWRVSRKILTSGAGLHEPRTQGHKSPTQNMIPSGKTTQYNNWGVAAVHRYAFPSVSVR
jgi:hypothetical protein